MIFWKLIIGTLLWSLVHGTDYDAIYNYNNHSYYFLTQEEKLYYYSYYCQQDSHYPVDITDEAENNVIASVIRNDRAIGIKRSYGGSKYYSIHTSKEASYTNFDGGKSSSYWDTSIIMQEHNGKWILAYRWTSKLIICEGDSISSSGVNITSDKIINLKNDYLLTYRGHSYYVYIVHRNYATTNQICIKQHDGYPFIPNDGLENCAINADKLGFIYVGMTLQKKNIVTEKGYEPSYLPWMPQQPKTQTCVIRNNANGEFETYDCNTKKHIICETDTVISGSNSTNCSYLRQHLYFAQILQYNGYAFRIFDFKTSKSDAILMCARRGEVLFVSQNETENCAVMESSEFKIELNYGEIYVKYVYTRGDGLLDNYTNWGSGYPIDDADKTCVYALYESGKWINDHCTNSTFVCREVRKEPSTATCSKNYMQNPDHSYSFGIYSKTYSLFANLLSFHDSVRLCSYYGQSLVQTSDSYIISKINDKTINMNFHLNYRILWNDTTLTWMDATPSGTPNWAPGEPKSNDFEISCVSVAPNKTWVTNSCHQKYIAVCVGNSFPTVSTASTTESSTTSTTATTTTTPPTSSTTENLTSTTVSQSNTAASTKKTKVALGVGLFFAILAILGVVLGVFIYKNKKFPTDALNKLKSFGSFRKQRAFSMDT